MQRVASNARGMTVVVGFIDCDHAARSDTGTIRKYNAAARRAGRTGAAARPQDAAPQLPLLRRQALLHARRGAGTGGSCAASGHARVGVSICEDMWDDFYDVKPLPELAAKRGERSLQPQRVAILSGQTPRARCPGSPAHPPVPEAGCLREHRRGSRQRQEHHPVRRREPRLRSRCTPRGHRPAVRGGSADRRPRRRGSPADRPPADRPRPRALRCAADGARRLHAQDGLHACHRGAVRRHRLGARAGARGGRARGRSGHGIQHAVEVQHRDDPFDCRTARRRARGALRRHPDPGHRRSGDLGVRGARAPHPARAHPREPAGQDPGPPDDGRVERHGRAADLLRERDGDCAWLRDALWRHVRRAVAHRRPLENGRLPAGTLRQRRHGSEKIPRETFDIVPVRGAGRQAVRPIRLLGRGPDRRRARGAPDEPGRARHPVRTPGARSHALPARRGGSHRLRQAHGHHLHAGRRRGRRAASGGRCTSAFRDRPSSPSRSVRSGSTSARRSSTAGPACSDFRRGYTRSGRPALLRRPARCCT